MSRKKVSDEDKKTIKALKNMLKAIKQQNAEHPERGFQYTRAPLPNCTNLKITLERTKHLTPNPRKAT